MRLDSWTCRAMLCAGLFLAMSGAVGQTYPSKSIRMIIPFSAGGSMDVLARIVAQQMSENVGQSVVPDNRPGASGNIAADLAAKAPPDGYTVAVVGSNLYCTNPLLIPDSIIDPYKDLTGVSLAVMMPFMLVVNPNVAVHSLKDLIALARANPGGMSYASAGIGTTPHIIGEQFKLGAKVNIVHIPYKGGAPALVDVVGGHVPMAFVGMPAALQYLRSGQVRGIAISSEKRSAAAPEYPTIAESGVAAFNSYTWYGYSVASATRKPIIAKLSTEIGRAVHGQAISRRLTEMGFDVVGSSPEQFNALIRTDCARVAKIMKEANIKRK